MNRNDIGGLTTKLTWQQTKAKSGNGNDCKWDFMKDGNPGNRWESKTVKDGDTAEFSFKNRNCINNYDSAQGKYVFNAARFVNIATDGGDNSKYCVRPTGGTGTASQNDDLSYPYICDGDE